MFQQFPRTFNIHEPGSFFKSTLVDDVQNFGFQETTRASVQQYRAVQAKTTRADTSGRAGQLQYPIGPALTSSEKSKADKACPTDQNGTMLCLDHLSNGGCIHATCKFTHELIGSYKGLQKVVIMRIKSMGGLAGQTPLTAEQATTQINSLREQVRKEA